MTQIGQLVDLTKILTEISEIKNINAYGANYYNNYYAPIFKNTIIINNIPVMRLNSIDEYILMELKIPGGDFVDNVNVFNITPYFYSFQDIDLFASVDKTLDFFKPKVYSGDIIKVVFTSSKTIGSYFENLGYLISKIPFEYLHESTFNFLIRVGNKSGTYKPESLIKYTKLILDKFTYDKPLVPYDALSIITSFPIPLSSKYDYNGQNLLLEGLLNYYDKQKEIYYKLEYEEIPTYLYLQNIPIPPVKYAFQSFYDAISVNPYVKLRANNTGESYFNSKLIDLENYKNCKIIILAVNQNAYGYGIYSNIHIYDNIDYTVIDEGSYLTSPNIPVINYPTYPYIIVSPV